MAVSGVPKIGIIDEVKNRQTGEISTHSGQVRDIIGRTSEDAERVYYGIPTSGNPPPINLLATADRNSIDNVIGEVVVKMYNSATDGIKTFEKNHPDMQAAAMPVGLTEATLIKEILKNENLDLNQDPNQAAKIVKTAFSNHQSEISQAQQKWSETAKNSKMFIAVSSGNDREVTDDSNPDIAQNMFAVDGVVTVAATDDNGNIASYSSPGSKISYSAPGTTGFKDENGNDVEGSSFAAPRVAAVAAEIMERTGKTKDEAKEELDKKVQKPNSIASNTNDDESSTEVASVSSRDTGKGSLAINT